MPIEETSLPSVVQPQLDGAATSYLLCTYTEIVVLTCSLLFQLLSVMKLVGESEELGLAQ